MPVAMVVSPSGTFAGVKVIVPVELAPEEPPSTELIEEVAMAVPAVVVTPVNPEGSER